MNNIDKILESKGDLKETKRLADLEKAIDKFDKIIIVGIK